MLPYYNLCWLFSFCLRVATKSTCTSKARTLATSPSTILYLPTRFTVCIFPFTRPGSCLVLPLDGTWCEGGLWGEGCVVVFIYVWVIEYIWRAMALSECPYGSHCGECVSPLTCAPHFTATKVTLSLVAYTLEPDHLWFKSCLSPPWP